MTKKDYETIINGLSLSDIVYFCDHELTVKRVDDNGVVSVSKIGLSLKKETSKFNANSGSFKCDGYTLKPYITKKIDESGKEVSWSFSPNTLKVNTPASRYTYYVQDGVLKCAKDSKNYDTASKSHINEVNKSAIKYLTAKKVNEINIEKALKEICLKAIMAYDRTVENLKEDGNSLNVAFKELFTAYRETLAERKAS